MANPEHLAKLKEGIEAWNKWREENPNETIDLKEANLGDANLVGVNFSFADLTRVIFREADLDEANLREAELYEANFRRANLGGANLHRAKLSEADFYDADLARVNLVDANLFHASLYKADLRGADLRGASLRGADLCKADLRKANLSAADLYGADFNAAMLIDADLSRASLEETRLIGADLLRANLTGADLSKASLIATNLRDATLTGCHVYGISAWNLCLEGAVQSNLVITRSDEPTIQVDNLEVAQFVYLLLNNERIRHVIDTITSKVVLILGRFTPGREAVLNAIRDELRKRDYLPVLFDFQKPDSKDLTGTVTTLANMARFIIADLTEPSSVPHELATIAPSTIVPVQTILLNGQREYAMFPDLMRRHHWVLEPYQYESSEALIAHLDDRVIAPAEAKAKVLRRNT